MDQTNNKQPPAPWPPFPGSLGLEITRAIDQQAWQQWLEMQIKIINENRLNLSEATDRQLLLQQLRQFLQTEATASSKP